MTDRLDAIEAGLRDGRYDCRVPGDTDDVRWLVEEVSMLREANMELRVQLRGEADARVGDLQQLSAEQASLEHDLTALRQRHAEAVKQAYREGWYASAPEVITPDADFDEECDAAWLASEARRGLAEKGGE